MSQPEYIYNQAVFYMFLIFPSLEATPELGTASINFVFVVGTVNFTMSSFYSHPQIFSHRKHTLTL